jgi:transposase InsO family protein
MPWEEKDTMELRLRFVHEALRGEDSMAALCEEAGISRQTGYKWLERFELFGKEGLKDRSRRPHRPGLSRAEEVVSAALALKLRYPQFGPKKLRAKLEEIHSDWQVPAASTIGEWLKRQGLTELRTVRRRCPPYTQPFAKVEAPNDVWSVDFKGWFRTGDGRRCDPLTVKDAFSRYLLACRAVDLPDHEHVQPRLDVLFREFGLPFAMRSDNGPPFATIGAGGLSRLSVWLIKLGVQPERIEPGKPEQNGRHERMHQTLKKAVADPPAKSFAAQQAALERFRREYNEERPHEAIAQKTPASLYRRSHRRYPRRLREPEYDAESAVRRVRQNGSIKWGGDHIFISEALSGEPVAIAETTSGDWQVRYATVELGFIGRNTARLVRRLKLRADNTSPP